MNRRAGKVPLETEYNRSITPIKKGTPISGGSIVPGNIIQTPQPATVRSVGCTLIRRIDKLQKTVEQNKQLLTARRKNVIEILQTEFEPRAEAKDLTLRITRCSDIILMGDRNRLVQIGNNLLSNAIKFTESGTVGLDMTYEAGKLVLTVQDTGTGMSHEQKEKIFEPFERLPNAAVKDGFGLGLPIVKNTVTLLGGTVDVESEEGKGSRFTVKLPMPLADNIIEIEKHKAGISARCHTAFYSVLVLDNDDA